MTNIIGIAKFQGLFLPRPAEDAIIRQIGVVFQKSFIYLVVRVLPHERT